jgi:hypothetical protein
LRGKQYKEISKETGYSFRYISGNVACKLWEMLSRALGESVQKNNLNGAIRRAVDSSS